MGNCVISRRMIIEDYYGSQTYKTVTGPNNDSPSLSSFGTIVLPSEESIYKKMYLLFRAYNNQSSSYYANEYVGYSTTASSSNVV